MSVEVQGTIVPKNGGSFAVTTTDNIKHTDGSKASDLLDTHAGYFNTMAKRSITKSFTTVAKMYAGSATNVICFGDSVTWGQIPTVGTQTANPYPSVLQTKLRKIYNNSNITVTNAGNPGYTTTQLLTVIDAQVITKTPDLVILMCGINDANPANSISRDTYKANLITMIQKILAIGSEVILVSSHPILKPDSDRNRLLLTYTRIMEDLAKQFALGFVDLNKEFQKLFLFKRTIPYTAFGATNIDYVHLGDDGYGYIAEIIIGKALNYNGLENIIPVINSESHIILANNNAVMTDCSSITVNTASEYAGQYYTLCSDSSTGTYLRFTFFADRDGMDLYLVAPKTKAGGQVSIYDNGTAAKTYDSFTAMTSITAKYGAEDILIENLSYGLHVIEFLATNIVLGQSASTIGKIYLAEFVFKSTLKAPADVTYKFGGTTYPTVEKFDKVSKFAGTLRLTGTGTASCGVLLQDDKTATLKSGKTLVVEAEGTFVADSGVSWFGSKADTAQMSASFGYLVNLTATTVDLYVFNDNAKVSLGSYSTTNTFTGTHKIRITHTTVGVITIFLDGTQALSVTDTKEKSGKFGLYVGASGGTVVLPRFEYCYI